MLRKEKTKRTAQRLERDSNRLSSIDSVLQNTKIKEEFARITAAIAKGDEVEANMLTFAMADVCLLLVQTWGSHQPHLQRVWSRERGGRPLCGVCG